MVDLLDLDFVFDSDGISFGTMELYRMIFDTKCNDLLITEAYLIAL